MANFVKKACFRSALARVNQYLHISGRGITKNILYSDKCMTNSQNTLYNGMLSKVCYHPVLASVRSASGPPTPEAPERKYQRPVDWLPFPWHRRPRYNPYEQSGDVIKVEDPDLTIPRPEFDLSEKLKTASEPVKKVFTLKTATLQEMRDAEMATLLKNIKQHPMDFDSLEVKVTIWTVKVRHLFRTQSKAEKPRHYNRCLYEAINSRNKYLNILYKCDRERFNWLVKELSLEFKPPEIGVRPPRYCKKWDLRRLTKEYCDNMRSEKLTAFHEELKSQQEAFLREKEETLAWIAKEEKELGVTGEAEKD